MTIAEAADLGRYKSLIPSSRDAGHTAFAHAVLDGTLPGTVFADGADVAQSAIICPEAGFFFAFGAPDRDLAIEVRDWATANRKQGGQWPIWASTDAWAETLEPLAHAYQSRHEYHFEGLPAGEPILADGYQVVALDAGLVAQFEGKVDPWVIGVWGGAEAMLQKAIGWAAVRDGELAAFCTMCAIGGRPGEIEAEIEIGTAAAARRQGLAIACGRAFIRDCLARGLQPAWTCDAANVASIASAAKLGFVQFRTIRGFVLT